MNINLFLSTLSINVIGSFVLFLVFLIQWNKKRKQISTTSDVTILRAEGFRVKLTQVIKDKGTLLLSITFLIVTVFFGRTEYIKQVSSYNLKFISNGIENFGDPENWGRPTKRISYMESNLNMNVLDIQIRRELKNFNNNGLEPSLILTEKPKRSILVDLREVYQAGITIEHLSTFIRLDELYRDFYEAHYGERYYSSGTQSYYLKRARRELEDLRRQSKKN